MTACVVDGGGGVVVGGKTDLKVHFNPTRLGL